MLVLLLARLLIPCFRASNLKLLLAFWAFLKKYICAIFVEEKIRKEKLALFDRQYNRDVEEENLRNHVKT